MKLINYICIVLSVMMLQSCEDFLTYKDKDKIIPSELTHYEELIYGELLYKEILMTFYKLDVMTDDVSDIIGPYTSPTNADKRIELYGWYTWAEEPQIDPAGNEHIDESWEFFYNKILMCNVIEEQLLEFGISGKRDRLIGEVRFIRAMSYFYLVNNYGLPYQNLEQSKTAAGVPINNETSIRQKSYKRSTLREVYDLIEENLISSLEYLSKGDGKETRFRPNKDVVKLFLARIYLFQNRFDDVIKVTNDLITNSGKTIEPLTNLKAYDEWNPYLYHSGNPSILFTFGNGSWGFLNSDAYDNIKYITSQELLDLYKTGDVRRKAFFDLYNLYPRKHRSYTLGNYLKCFRIEEAYLMRAEAYAEKGEITPALNDINYIRKERFDEVAYERTTSDKATAIEYVREERRIEMCFEDLRWYDIRRWGLEIEHRHHDRNRPTEYKVFKLKKNSPNYTLSLPLLEQRTNYVIEQFPRENSGI